MATTYKLSYTASEINEKLGKVDENATNISKLSEEKVDKTNEEETLKLVTEMGLVEPVLSEDGLLYTDKDGMLFSL